MKQFYEHVRVDGETLRFYAVCPICGRKQYGPRLPLICWSVRALTRCEKGQAARLWQSAFNRARANATQQLAMQFNQCRYCYRLVCDDCYDSADALGACRDCSRKNETLPPPIIRKTHTQEKGECL